MFVIQSLFKNCNMIGLRGKPSLFEKKKKLGGTIEASDTKGDGCTSLGFLFPKSFNFLWCANQIHCGFFQRTWLTKYKLNASVI